MEQYIYNLISMLMTSLYWVAASSLWWRIARFTRVLFELPCGGTVRKRSVKTPTQIIAIFIWTYYTSTFTNLLHAL